jgi:hypothetical protein
MLCILFLVSCVGLLIKLLHALGELLVNRSRSFVIKYFLFESIDLHFFLIFFVILHSALLFEVTDNVSRLDINSNLNSIISHSRELFNTV